jgi:flagellar biogenesis protein FliO
MWAEPTRAIQSSMLKALAPALVALPAEARLTGADSAPDIDLLRIAAALLLCLGLGIAAILLLRRHGTVRLTAAAGGTLRVVESVRLGRGALHVVEFDGQRLLLATDAHGSITVAHDSGRGVVRESRQEPQE